MEVIELNIASVVTNAKKERRCTIYIPSHGLTTHGEDFMEAMSVAISTLTAIYHYNREHNLPFNESWPLPEVTKMCSGKQMFPTYITLEV